MNFTFPLPYEAGAWRNIAKMNYLLIVFILLWSAVGLFMLLSAQDGTHYIWVERQMMFLSLGFVLMLLIALSNPSFWLTMAWPIYGLAIILLILVEFFGVIGMGAQRWLEFAGLRLQPAEITKAALILGLARYYHGLSASETRQIRTLIIPLLIILVPAILVVRQPDLGTAIMIILSGLMVLFLAGVRLWKFMLMGGLVLASLPFAWSFILHDYQKKRVLSFLNPEQDLMGSGYHITQSKIALGSGGMTGQGYKQGTQSHNQFLPEKHTDFIFTMIGEEFGFLGTLALLFLFMLLALSAIYLAFRAKSQFNRLLCFGMINNFALYVMINIAMVTGLTPVVGVPLPLISYGGSAALSALVGFGFILMVGINKDRYLVRS